MKKPAVTPDRVPIPGQLMESCEEAAEVAEAARRRAVQVESCGEAAQAARCRAVQVESCGEAAPAAEAARRRAVQVEALKQRHPSIKVMEERGAPPSSVSPSASVGKRGREDADLPSPHQEAPLKKAKTSSDGDTPVPCAPLMAPSI